jgi:hypothetical protein
LQTIMLFEPWIASNVDNYKLENTLVSSTILIQVFLSDTISHVKIEG